MQKVLICFLLLTLAIPFPASVFAEEETIEEKATIVVYTKTLEGDLIQGINISLKTNNYDQAKNTDVQGKAVFSGLQAGEYTIKINLTEGSNYELTSGEIATKNKTVQAGEQVEVYFGVKPKQKETVNQKEDNEQTIEIKLPTRFYLPTSTTTKLQGYTKDQLKSIQNFTLHVPDIAKIVFNTSIDLSMNETVTRLNKLDQYVFMDHPGEVSIATDLMPELNKPATVTLYGLNFVSLGSDYTPAIMKDDAEAGKNVENIILTGSSAVSFDVTEFSTYSIRPTLKFEELEYDVDQPEHEIEGMIDDLDSEIIVYLNDEKLTQAVSISDDGSFTVPVELQEGENIVQVIATGISEQSTTERLTIINTTTDTQEEDGTNSFTLIIAILLILSGIGLVTAYLIKTKKIKLFKKKDTTTKTKPQFDSRLLTPEEKAAYDTKISNKESELTPKM